MSDEDSTVPPCDFCGLEGFWWFESRPFTRRVAIGQDRKIHALTTSRTAWAACVVCGGSIRAGRWDVVTARQFTAANLADGPFSDPEAVHRGIADLHLHIADNLTGVSAPMAHIQEADRE
jgi:hypothetical protein